MAFLFKNGRKTTCLYSHRKPYIPALRRAAAYKTNPGWGVLTSFPVFLHSCAQLLVACCNFFCLLSGYRWQQMLQKWSTTCLRSHPSSVAGSWKRWSDCSDAECHSGRGFSASWGSGVSPCSLLILCTALFSSLWAWNYCCAALFGLDFPLPWFLLCGTVSRHGADSTHICQDSFTCASSSILQSSLLEHEMVEYKVGRFLSVFLSSAALVIFEFFLSVRQFWRLTWQGELSGPLKSQ